MIFKGYLFGALYGIFCLCLALVFYKLGMPKKYTRKTVHILVGFEWFILYHFLGAGVHFLAVCIFFMILLAVSYRGRLLPMISSDADNAPGTVYYGVAMTSVAIVGCFLPEVMLPFGVGIMCTSLGDGAAGAVGQLVKKHNPRVYQNKTLFGTLANLLVSFTASLLLSHFYDMGITALGCLCIALVSVGLELIVGRGLDNIAVTWGATALAYAFMYTAEIWNYVIPIVLTPFIIALVIERKALTKWGIALAAMLDLVVSICLGNFGFIILLAFLGGSIAIDKIKKRAKNHGREETAKGDCRDAIQVIANGLVPFATACGFVFSGGNPAFAVAFVASLAEAFADTAASGLGAFSRRAYDPFRRRECTGGISGGMSVIGTLSSLVGAFLIGALAMLVSGFSFGVKYFLIASLTAFLGAIIDSMLGSLVQVKYRCPVCGTLTEKQTHCDNPTARECGLSFVDNDVVNITSGFITALIAFVLAMLI